MDPTLPSVSEIAAVVRRALDLAATPSRAEETPTLAPRDPAPRDIVAVYLFGSFARAKAHAGSDVDLGLLYATAPPATLLARPFLLEADLAQLLRRPVQCIVMNDAPVDLVHRILSDRCLLLDRAPAQRIRFEVRARNAYFDLKPVLERYRRTEPRP